MKFPISALKEYPTDHDDEKACPDAVKPFPMHIKPAFERLMEAQREWKKMDLGVMSKEDILSKLEMMETLERNVMVAYAECTKDINPGLLSDVERGSVTYTLRMEENIRHWLQ